MAAPKTTAVTENDKINAARAKDYDANLKATADVDVADRTAAHESADGRLPSDVDAFATEHQLTSTEAADALARGGDQSSVDAVKSERTVYRQVWVEQPAGASSPYSELAVPAAPVPPAPEVFDPYAPKGDEPTGHVAGTDRAEGAQEAAAAYVEAADAVTETVDDLGTQKPEDGPVVPTE